MEENIIKYSNIIEPSLVDKDGILIRREVPADNSCLFSSIAYVLQNHSKSSKILYNLRKIIADVILTDENYNEAILGKSKEEYSKWILNSTSWGGAIELSIFSKYFQTEIAVFDCKTKKMNLFGEGCNYKQRVLLIYDGIHYDPLAFTFDKNAPEEMDIVLFSPKDDVIIEKAYELTEKANKLKLFTDTSNFDLRCTNCQQGLIGQKGAIEHAKKTGHTNFVEY